MRAFACPVCNAFVAFEAEQCANCRAPLGFHLPSKSMLPVVDGSAIVAGQRWVACTQQATLGCNWLAPDGQTSYERGRCLAHSLIRREPVADDTLAREKLVPTAAALRRLVYQLDDIGLPIEPFWRRDGGLAFDLLSSYTTGDRVTIGHAGGVITIDLVESLDDYREAMRVRLGEPYRTMLGHCRHEIGRHQVGPKHTAAAGQSARDRRRRTVLGLGCVEFHQRQHHPGGRRHSLTTSGRDDVERRVRLVQHTKQRRQGVGVTRHVQPG